MALCRSRLRQEDSVDDSGQPQKPAEAAEPLLPGPFVLLLVNSVVVPSDLAQTHAPSARTAAARRNTRRICTAGNVSGGLIRTPVVRLSLTPGLMGSRRDVLLLGLSCRGTGEAVRKTTSLVLQLS